MSVRVRLLGSPSVEVDGVERRLSGWKPWGLLARLVLAEGSASRTDLAELLWPAAEDPAAALRWSLHQLRKVLEPHATIADRGGRLTLETGDATAGGGLAVDAREVLDGTVRPDDVEDVARGPLLHGLHFAGAPAFELWLGIEQARLDSALRSTLRWAATMSVTTDPDRALRLVARALALDPFDDAAHELAIEVHVQRGDLRAAQAHADSVSRLYRLELGSPPPPRIRRPLERPAHADGNPLIDRGVAGAATLDVARARLAAGEYDSSIASARRASLDAAAAGDPELEAQALAVLAEGLIHGRRGLDVEAVGLLDRALRLAVESDALALAADIERESGYVSFLAADYGGAEVALHRSIALARRCDDRCRVGRALTILGACRSDQGALDDARALLEGALDELASSGDRRWHAYALSFLARVQLAAGDTAAAAETARRSIDGAREAGWTALVPFPTTFEGEAMLAAGDATAAAASFGEALAMAQEMDDPCWLALSLRGFALVRAADGDTPQAISLLTQALNSCRRYPDTYKWAEILIVTELVELERGADRTRLAEARRLAHASGLVAIVERIDSVLEQQTLRQTPAP